ncbi:TrbI/VirB10 family protein [Vibrio sp. ZSDZ65]|uniref:TrbI/VirB10 family protein n=1 Tax=Vibrio qingdaonensis TaxID=2829491 RepID=A0A9X3CS83_9VIBR|nr:TrbI/VirB10 family protein [Vibrio qingdaonensis]MCW8348733.1 TrbI/VirB10 family protein [Vibrio qingdaonensis]
MSQQKRSSPQDFTQAVNDITTPREQAKDTDEVLANIEPEHTPVSSQAFPVVLDPFEQAKQQHEVEELSRALSALKTRWVGGEPIQSHNIKASQTSPSFHTRQVGDEVRSSDEQREMIAKRIQEAEALKAQILRGDYTPEALTQKTAELNSLSKRFDTPPTNIAGFTEENAYNASIEGKLKIPVGTIIPAVTMMKTNSDHPGTFKAVVSQDIFDVDLEYVLIPKGSEVILKSVTISNVNEVINRRMGLTVPWVVLPNGNRVDLSKSSGLDREGIGAVGDQVDRHYLAQFFGVAAYALLASSTSWEGTGETDQSYTSAISSSLRNQAAPIAQKYLALKPTVTIRAGQSINVMVEDDIYLTPWRYLYEEYL